MPDLVHACLDLLIDRKSGIWRLNNGKALIWAALAARAAALAGVAVTPMEAKSSAQLRNAARRPRYSALHSERGVLLPSLDNALGRYLALYDKQGVGSKPIEPYAGCMAHLP